jgi:hypothetical protein
LGGVLFALAHLRAFCFTATAHPTCVFPLLTNDMHIVGLTLNVLPIFLQLQKEFGAIKNLVQLTKCVIWSPQG